MSGKDHRNDRAVVGDVQSGVCQGFVLWFSAGAGEVCEPGDLVEQSDDQTVDRSDGASGDVVRPVVGLLLEEYEELVRLVGDHVLNKIVSDVADKLVGNGYGEGGHKVVSLSGSSRVAQEEV